MGVGVGVSAGGSSSGDAGSGWTIAPSGGAIGCGATGSPKPGGNSDSGACEFCATAAAARDAAAVTAARSLAREVAKLDRLLDTRRRLLGRAAREEEQPAYHDDQQHYQRDDQSRHVQTLYDADKPAPVNR